MVNCTLEETIAALRAIHKPSHAIAKRRLRQPAMDAMRTAIDRELTMAAYAASNQARSAVRNAVRTVAQRLPQRF